ncbi:NERD domain-containing protein [Massilia sp. TN1-12]|uniref:NERD domain-containing protein n=1 Tax=Massilia paldalensis TaxID=3377675 RepID=UPI00384E3AF5
MFDPFSLLQHVLAPFWWLLLIPLLTVVLRLPTVKGWVGETILHTGLRLLLPSARYHLMRNVTLPTKDGSTQIDHVVVSRHGVFVIETKNYGGWIFGKPEDKMWTQKFPGRSSAFQNPLRQNDKHVRTLAELTGLDDNALFSQIVFVGNCTFKTPMPANVGKLAACLAAIRGRDDVLLSDGEVAQVLDRIRTGRLAPTRATHKAHVRHVQALLAGKRAGGTRAAPTARAQDRGDCPACGGAVDEYTYKTGAKAGQSFHGCTRFPACTYRSDVPERVAEAVA